MPCCEVPECLYVKLRPLGRPSHGWASLFGTPWLSLTGYSRTQLPAKFPLLQSSLVQALALVC